MKRLTREWVRKAEKDYRAARRLFLGKEPLHDQSCFMCQQCAEKYLKAMMQEDGLKIPRIHVLETLHASLLPRHPSLKSLQRGLSFLTRFAVGTRYPGDSASKRKAVSAQRVAGKVRERCRVVLGL